MRALQGILVVALAAFYRFTRFGIVTRAVAQNERAAAVICEALTSVRFRPGAFVRALTIAPVASIRLSTRWQCAPTSAS